VIPLGLVATVVASAVAGPIFATRVLALVGGVLSPQGTVVLEEALTSRAGRGGATVAGWTGLVVVFGIYTATATSFQLYGVLGGAFLALTWFYLAGLLLLGGAVLNTVIAGRRDRQVQHEGLREVNQARMSDTDEPDGDAPAEEDAGAAGAAGADRVEAVEQRVEYADIAELRRELDRLEADIEDRTVRRGALESDLKRYVRRRVRRGKARGWGPYLVLLYGTAMTLGAFAFLSGVWAILALIIVWLSTLGLYTLMVLVGMTFTLAGLPGRLRETVEDIRD
jgi:hypothetical protein